MTRADSFNFIIVIVKISILKTSSKQNNLQFQTLYGPIKPNKKNLFFQLTQIHVEAHHNQKDLLAPKHHYFDKDILQWNKIYSKYH